MTTHTVSITREGVVQTGDLLITDVAYIDGRWTCRVDGVLVPEGTPVQFHKPDRSLALTQEEKEMWLEVGVKDRRRDELRSLVTRLRELLDFL